MITTLGPWQIVGLTLLTLIVAVILNRLVILTVWVVSRHWSETHRNAMFPNVESLPQTGWNVSGDRPLPVGRDTYWDRTSQTTLRYRDTEQPVMSTAAVDGRSPTSEEWANLLVSPRVEELGSTGANPGGVSYDTDSGKFVKDKRFQSKRRKRLFFGGRK